MSEFPGLSASQIELLALLAEELGEAQQAIGKILRHGYESYNPFDAKQLSNRESLEHELGDVRAATSLLIEAGELGQESIAGWAERKRESVFRYLHHQGKASK